MEGGEGMGNGQPRYEMHVDSVAELPAGYDRQQEMKTADARVAAGYDGAYRGH